MLTVVHRLQATGWTAAARTVTHVSADPGDFDGREAMRMRHYYNHCAVKHFAAHLGKVMIH